MQRPSARVGLAAERFGRGRRGQLERVFIAGVAVICVVLFVLALLAPRLAHKPHQATNRTLAVGARAASHAPGLLGRWLPKPFRTSERATSKSVAAGSAAHDKISDKL